MRNTVIFKLQKISMIIEVDKSFEKDFSKIRDKNIQNRVIAKLDLLE